MRCEAHKIIDFRREATQLSSWVAFPLEYVVRRENKETTISKREIVLSMRLVRIALWIFSILFSIPVLLVVPLHHYFGIELGDWVILVTWGFMLFVLLLLAVLKSEKTDVSSSNSEETT